MEIQQQESLSTQSLGGRVSTWWEKQTGRPLNRKDKIIGGIFLIIFLFVFYVTLDANKYQATVRVIEGQGAVGINPTTERLDFGDLSRGTSAVRRVALQNSTFMPMYVVVIKFGALADLMDVDKNYFTLKPETEERIEFSVYMPASAEKDKTYNGRVYLFKIPTFGL